MRLGDFFVDHDYRPLRTAEEMESTRLDDWLHSILQNKGKKEMKGSLLMIDAHASTDGQKKCRQSDRSKFEKCTQGLRNCF